MLHIGHFSFDALDNDNNPEHGYFTAIVDADSPKAALDVFTRQVLQLKKSQFAFSHLERIYLEDIIRVKEVPGEPLVTLLQSSKGPFPRSISYSLPATDRAGVDAYGLASDVSRESAETSGSYIDSEPMIDFFLGRSA